MTVYFWDYLCIYLYWTIYCIFFQKIREKDDLAIQLQDTSEQLGHAKANLENSEVSLAQILEYCSQYDSPDVESCKGVIQAKITKLQEDLEQINIR